MRRERRLVAGRVERAGKDLAQRRVVLDHEDARRVLVAQQVPGPTGAARPGRRDRLRERRGRVERLVAWGDELDLNGVPARGKVDRHVPHIHRGCLHAVQDDREVVLRRCRGNQRTAASRRRPSAVSGEPTVAPVWRRHDPHSVRRSHEQRRTEYPARRPGPPPRRPLRPHRYRYALRRTAKTRSPPPKMSSASPIAGAMEGC